VKRAMIAEKNPTRILEFIFFNLCYSSVYADWLQHDVLSKETNGFSKLMNNKFSKPLSIKLAEYFLDRIRQRKTVTAE